MVFGWGTNCSGAPNYWAWLLLWFGHRFLLGFGLVVLVWIFVTEPTSFGFVFLWVSISSMEPEKELHWKVQVAVTCPVLVDSLCGWAPSV